MKNKITYILLLLMFSAAFASCKKQKTIPDDTLSDIFRDIYLVNAYANQKGAGIDFDSINIYEPILNEYGYSSQDMIHTMGNFSKRKSARLSSIVEDAISKLDAMNIQLTAKVRVLERVDSIAFALTRETVHTDSLISIRSLADSVKTKLVLPVRKGKYEIQYYHTQDSADLNYLNIRHQMKDSLDRPTASSSTRPRQRQRQHYKGTLDASERARTLEITFGNYPAKPRMPMGLEIDSLVISYVPQREEALERLLRSYIDYTLIIDGREYHEYYNLPADSSALHIQPPLAPEEPDTVAVQ